MTAANSSEYFEQVAKTWDDMRKGFFTGAAREAALDRLEVKSGCVAVDLGAGTGYMTEALVSRGLSVIAVDSSKAMLAELAREFGSAHVETRLVEGDTLPLASDSVDYVVANMYLHHVEEPEGAIAEAARVLRPGGGLAISDLDQHDFAFLREEHHDRWMGFDHEDVRGWLLKSGLVQVALAPIGSTCQADSDDGMTRASIGIFLATGFKPE